MLFPFEKPRRFQDELMADIREAIEKNEHLLAEAPPGIGKTVAALSVALEYEKPVFFLANRNTQKEIAVRTAKLISKIKPVKYVKFVSKQKLCKHKFNVSYRVFLSLCERLKCADCPYTKKCIEAQEAQLIIADYNHIFNPEIRKKFLGRIKKSLEGSILIVDEAHNLVRLRETLSITITRQEYEKAKLIAKEFNIELDLDEYFKDGVFRKKPEYDSALDVAATYMAEKENDPLLMKIFEFMMCDESYAIIGSPHMIKAFHYDLRSLGKVFERVDSAILMSATLSPLQFYKRIYGLGERTRCKEYGDPFKEKRKLIIYPISTTLFKRREKEVEKLRELCKSFIRDEKKTLIAFPSYELMHKVCEGLDVIMECKDKEKVIREFLMKDKPLAIVASGSLSEGMDFPGKFRQIVVIGVPVPTPSVENEIIAKHYDEIVGNGKEYAYVLPAMQKVKQIAGRLIRNEKDYGKVILVDVRYRCKKYSRYLPKWPKKFVYS